MDQTPQQPTPATAKKSQRTLWAIICLAGPTALLVLTFIAFAIINWVFAATTGSYDDGATMTRVILNIVLWFVGAIASISWLPGIIVGIILLATKPASPRQ